MGSIRFITSTALRTRRWAWSRAEVVLGGAVNGERFEFGAGDVAILPARTGHCNDGSSGDFLVVGAYPRGQDRDLRRGDPAEHDEVVGNVSACRCRRRIQFTAQTRC